MIKYIYTTLAIGEKYFYEAIKFSHDLYHKDNNFFRIIVSNISNSNIPNTKTISIPSNSVLKICNYFNYNLKYLAIKEASKINCEYIIYTDADWRIHNEYLKQKIDLFFENNTLHDFYFERPHRIGDGKKDGMNCFWKHKINAYNLLDTNIYDDAHVCNEQFLIFKNNDKLKLFIDAWEQKNQFCIDNNIWTFAEGVEIGMSTIDAGINSQYSMFHDLRNCFEFNDISGNLFVRF